MTTLVNRAKMTTATTGTGTITLGSAVDGYQTFANAGVANADVVRYVIEDGDAWEIGLGTYSAGTLTRGSIESSNSDLALSLTGNAVVYVSAAAADLQELVDFADNFVLPTADGSTGQVLTTNGAGTLTFSTITGYTDADVDTHLNTSSATSGEVLSWTGADYDWVTVAAGATDINGLSDGFAAGDSYGLGAGALVNDDGTANKNTAVGYFASNAITNGSFNAAIGDTALAFTTSGDHNVAVGYRAGQLNLTNDNGVFVGSESGRYSRSEYSVALGRQALYGSTASTLTGTSNIGIGYQTGYDLSTGSNNFLGGYRAGTNLTTGSNNVAIGNGALDAATTGGINIAIGLNAMGIGVATAANGHNVCIGNQSGEDISTAVENCFYGRNSGRNVTTGSQNTFLGSQTAVSLTTGSNNTIVGFDANPSSTTVSNEITLGNSSIATLRCQVTTITSLSDARDKADIQPLNAGLEFVEALNPVSFTWNMRDGGKVGEADTGFIAQDLQAAQADTGVSIPGLVYDVNPDKLEAGYGKLVPVLVQAIKDLSAEVKDLKAQLETK